VNGAASFVLNRAFQGISPRTDGVGKWAFEDEAGPIDNTPIGATTPSTGAFTTLTATSLTSATFNGGVLPIRGFLGGLTLSNDATSSNTVIDISAGARPTDDASLMVSLPAFTKSTASGPSEAVTARSTSARSTPINGCTAMSSDGPTPERWMC
jgi:hypothetical protein